MEMAISKLEKPHVLVSILKEFSNGFLYLARAQVDAWANALTSSIPEDRKRKIRIAKQMAIEHIEVDPLD